MRCSRPPARPAEVVDKLHGEIKRALDDETVKQRLRAAGVEPGIGRPADVTRMLQARIPQWADVIKSAGIKVD